MDVSNMLHLSNFSFVFLNIIILLIFYYLIGYVFIDKFIDFDRYIRKEKNNILFVPIYTSVGLSVFTILLHTVSLLIINRHLSIITFSIVISFGLVYLGIKKIKLINTSTNSIKKIEINRDSLIDLLVYFITVIYFSYAIYKFKWPPIGDAINHSFYVSLIINNSRIPNAFTPISDFPFFYPKGFHINAAFFSLLLQIYPAESVFLFGGFLIIILITMIYAMSFLFSRSRLAALFMYILSFQVYYINSKPGNLERWIVGYFFNGPYPNIYGLLMVFLSFSLVTLAASNEDLINNKKYTLIHFPIIIALLLTYPNFTYFVIIFLLINLRLNNRKQNFKDFLSFLTKDRHTFAYFIINICLLIYYSYYIYVFEVAPNMFIKDKFFRYKGINLNYMIPQSYLFGGIFGHIMVLGLVLSIFYLIISGLYRIKNQQDELLDIRFIKYSLITYVFIMIVLLSSTDINIYKYLYFVILPDRAIIIILILSWLINYYIIKNLIYLLLSMINYKNIINKNRRIIRSPKRNSMLISILILFLLFNDNIYVSLQQHASGQLIEHYSWFSKRESFKTDIKVLEWVIYNIPSCDLILNDFSWSSLYILGLSLKNITSHYNYIFAIMNRTKDALMVWLNPSNESLLISFLRRYNVSYILSTSEIGYFNYLEWKYKSKPYSPKEYIEILEKYNFLKIIYRNGDAAVFKVIKEYL